MVVLHLIVHWVLLVIGYYLAYSAALFLVIGAIWILNRLFTGRLLHLSSEEIRFADW